ncbi:hypothetical protein JZ751_020339 [Albula glossodonta]|uniref:Uncharacterized protein n=1 Tax=Albula glossodonta TaxID=121402 RepID=A0A8T2NWI4_9TELE|nr:hypothetical protein JZ751_020339 [Albula glossodonta]
MFPLFLLLLIIWNYFQVTSGKVSHTQELDSMYLGDEEEEDEKHFQLVSPIPDQPGCTGSSCGNNSINKFTKKLRNPFVIENNEIMDFLQRVPSDIQKDCYASAGGPFPAIVPSARDNVLGRGRVAQHRSVKVTVQYRELRVPSGQTPHKKKR